LAILPDDELNRIHPEIIEKYFPKTVTEVR
jgi:hypothetical protein